MSTEATERFEQRLDTTMQSMQSCQKEKNVTSCSECDEFIGCSVRKEYVQSVYDSMSKGETGGFEF
ncbi:MAG: hypothetical protein U9Q62_07600 [Campylobacterota bacterium]|nr:hypothetical protein [Campylobacterota bacterium]